MESHILEGVLKVHNAHEKSITFYELQKTIDRKRQVARFNIQISLILSFAVLYFGKLEEMTKKHDWKYSAD